MRALNRRTVFDAEPMPNIEELFSKLSRHNFFSRLDLSKCYWQVKLTDDSKHKTAFQTPKGLFQFKVMAGLVSTPATCSRLMHKLHQYGIDSGIFHVMDRSFTGVAPISFEA